MPSNAAARMVRLRNVNGPIFTGVNSWDSFIFGSAILFLLTV